MSLWAPIGCESSSEEKDMWRHRHAETENRNLKKGESAQKLEEARRDWSLDPLKAHTFSGPLNSDF